MKITPPAIFNLLSEILFEMNLPNKIAAPVQIIWPRDPPMKTANLFVETAKTTVESCDLSPHSAMKVSTKAFRNTGLIKIRKKDSIFRRAFFKADSSTEFSAESGDTAPVLLKI